MTKHEQILNHLYGISDIELLVLKCHLMIEDVLTDIIQSVIPNSKLIDIEDLRLSYLVKAKLCHGFCAKAPSDEIWTFIYNINALRNKYAHSLEHADAAKSLAALLKNATAIIDDDLPELSFYSSRELCLIGTATITALGFLDHFQKDIASSYSFWHEVVKRKTPPN